MKSQTRAVVIGGGIAGYSSTLYHLTQEGWTDGVLVERRADQWHHLALGGAGHELRHEPDDGRPESHSIALYKELAEDPDYPINYHHADGGIRLANTDAQMDGYRHFASMARGMGVEFEVLDAEECARRHPLITTDNLVGGLWDPLDGDIDPAQLCQALARRRRLAQRSIATRR